MAFCRMPQSHEFVSVTIRLTFGNCKVYIAITVQQSNIKNPRKETMECSKSMLPRNSRRHTEKNKVNILIVFKTIFFKLV